MGIVTNVRTGEILGMASYPAFDPNDWAPPRPTKMLNHVAADGYEPGSVFKVFTLAMGLDSGVATLNTKFDARTPLVLAGADASTTSTRTSDTCRCGRCSPIPPTSAPPGWACSPARTGWTTISTPSACSGPRPASWRSRPARSCRSELSDNTVASMSFGQAISVSPLALATGMGSILNGGEYIPLTIRKLDQAPKGRRVISEETSRTMLDLMRLNAVQGTGRQADMRPAIGSAARPERRKSRWAATTTRQERFRPSPPSSPPTARSTPTAISC